MIRVIIRTMIVIAVACAVFFFAAAVIVGTTTGSRWLIERVLVANFDALELETFDGRLSEAFELHGVNINVHPIAMDIDHIEFRWRPQALLRGKLVIEMARLTGVETRVAATTETADPPSAIVIPAAPIAVDVGRLVIDGLLLRLPGQEIRIDRVGAGFAWTEEAAVIDPLEVDAAGHELRAHARMTVGDRPHVMAEVDWLGEVANEPGEAHLSLNGALDKLSFDAAIEAIGAATLKGKLNALAAEPSYTVDASIFAPAQDTDVTIAPTQVNVNGSTTRATIAASSAVSNPTVGDIALEVNLDMNFADPLGAKIHWRAQPTQGEPVVGRGDIRIENDAIVIVHTTAAPYTTRVTGTVNGLADEQQIDLQLTWEDIRQEIADFGLVHAPSGALTLVGPLNALQTTLTAAFTLPHIGNTSISSEARISPERAVLQELRIALLDGELLGTGEIDYAGDLTGQLQFAGRDVDLSAINPTTRTRLDFRGETTFAQDADGIELALVVSELSGFINRQAITGALRARTNGQTHRIEQFKLAAGANKFDIEATLGAQIAGHFDVQLREPSLFDQRVSGSLEGTGKFGGSPDKPQVIAAVRGRDLSFAGSGLRRIDATLDIDLAQGRHSDANVVVETLSVGAKDYGNLTIVARGQPTQHTFKISLSDGLVDGLAVAAGAWQDSRWSGHLTTLDIANAAAGEWHLESASPLVASAAAVSLSETCLVGANGRACLGGDYAVDASHARVVLEALPLSLFNALLPANLRLDGNANGRFDVALENAKLRGDGLVRFDQAAVSRLLGENDRETFALQDTRLDFSMLADELRVNATAKLEEWFSLNAQILASTATSGPVDADISVHSDDIRWIADFAPALGGTHGGFDLRLNVDGTVAEPRIDAHFDVVNGAVMIPDIGLDLTTISGTVNGDGRAAALSIQLGAGDAKLALSGSVNALHTQDPRVDFVVAGEEFPLMRTPDIDMDISPDIKITGSRDALDIDGSLLLPKVLVDLKRLPPSAVTVSEDQVIVGAENSSANSSFFTEALSGQLAVILGDEISVNGFGLESELSGNLKWGKRRGVALGRANGAINIDRGVYSAYGQNLQVESGRIQFAGPVDNPRINVRALRPDLPVRVGVDVSGSIRAPKIDLFSEPPLSDANTLSYLVTGHALGEGSGGDASVLTQAALTLGAEKSAFVTNQIRSTFGLDELSVETGTTARDTSLVAGKRLSPKLSIRTGFNPFDQLWSFFLNYKLTERWSVEAESGEQQGADLLYSIEFE